MLYYIPYLVPCFCCLFWMVNLVCGWRQSPRTLRIATVAFGFMGVASFIRFVFLLDIYKEVNIQFVDIVEVFCVFGFLSCLALIFRTLTDATPLRWRDFLVFLPGLLLTALLMGIYFWIGREEISFLIRYTAHSYEDKIYPDALSRMYCILYIYVYKVMVILFVNALLIYAWKSLALYRAVYRFLFTLLLFALFLLTWDYLVFLKAYTLIAFSMCLWGCALYYLGYHLSRVEYRDEDPADERTPADRQVNEEDEAEAESWYRIKEKLHAVLLQLMDEDKLFLSPHLRLDELALKVNTNRTYLLRLIKEEYGCGFSEYMARKRVKYACDLIQSDRDLTLEQVAGESGFTHGTTFSRTFKQYTGMTFREWQKGGKE